MNEQRVQEIRARLAGATPGPWGSYKDVTLDGRSVWRIGSNATGEDIGTVIDGRDFDAWLIHNAPTDLADLLAERDRLLAVVEAADAVVAVECEREPKPISEVILLRTRLRAYRRADVRAYRAATTGEAGQ